MGRDFEPVCTARTVSEAELIAAWFVGRRIRAHVKDANMVNVFTWGLPAIAPRGIEVVVPPEEIEGARALWAEHAEELLAARESVDEGRSIETDCEGCGERVSFAATSAGRVEDCPLCGDYVDVPEAST